jgi:uncharacterized protein (DUF1501 family)
MNQERSSIPQLTRRQLLKALGLAGTAGVVGACAGKSGKSGGAEGTAPTIAVTDAGKGKSNPKGGAKKQSPKPTTQPNDRILVLVEMQGGNDGFATLVPYADDRLRKLRERIWIDPKDLVVMDDKYAMAKGLEPVKNRLAFVEGVGVAKPDLSHFAMLQRWWAGDPDGTGTFNTGFLGRCCDVLHNDEVIAGVSVGSGSNPAMIAAKAATVSLPQLDLVREIAKGEPAEQRLRAALRNLATTDDSRAKLGLGDDADRFDAVARHGLGSGLELLETLTRLGERPKVYPENNDLASAFALTRQLVSLNTGMRVFHIPWGSFDTHTNETGDHGSLMTQFGTALAAFHSDLEANGLADRVLVATASEFGRRPAANAGGTDHGTASVMLMSGPVKPGRHGETPNLGQLDSDGNVKATVSMSDYYATLASWLGIDPSVALSPGATPLTGVLV